MYKLGHGVEINYSLTLLWYTKSTDQGFPCAIHNICLIYRDGSGVEQDYKKAMYYFQKADTEECHTQNEIGLCTVTDMALDRITAWLCIGKQSLLTKIMPMLKIL